MRRFLRPSTAPAWLPAALALRWNQSSAALAEMRKRARQARRLNPQNTLRLEFEPVRFLAEDGFELAAWYVPCPGARAGVILHHHYGGQKAYTLPWIELFHRQGLACFTIDGRGHGESAEVHAKDSLLARGADVRAAAEALRTRGVSRLIGFGQSQGAAIVLLGLPEAVGFIVDSGPAPDLLSAIWGVSRMLFGEDDDPWVRALLTLRVVLGIGGEPLRYGPALWSALHRYRDRPLLRLHGGRDEVITPAASRLWYSALRPPGELWQSVEVAEAGHVRTLQDGGEAVSRAVVEFLERVC